MSIGFVAWECQVHNQNPCGKYVFPPLEEAKIMSKADISVMGRPMGPQTEILQCTFNSTIKFANSFPSESAGLESQTSVFS